MVLLRSQSLPRFHFLSGIHETAYRPCHRSAAHRRRLQTLAESEGLRSRRLLKPSSGARNSGEGEAGRVAELPEGEADVGEDAFGSPPPPAIRAGARSAPPLAH